MQQTQQRLIVQNTNRPPQMQQQPGPINIVLQSAPAATAATPFLASTAAPTTAPTTAPTAASTAAPTQPTVPTLPQVQPQQQNALQPPQLQQSPINALQSFPFQTSQQSFPFFFGTPFAQNQQLQNPMNTLQSTPIQMQQQPFPANFFGTSSIQAQQPVPNAFAANQFQPQLQSISVSSQPLPQIQQPSIPINIPMSSPVQPQNTVISFFHLFDHLKCTKTEL